MIAIARLFVAEPRRQHPAHDQRRLGVGGQHTRLGTQVGHGGMNVETVAGAHRRQGTRVFRIEQIGVAQLDRVLDPSRQSAEKMRQSLREALRLARHLRTLGRELEEEHPALATQAVDKGTDHGVAGVFGVEVERVRLAGPQSIASVARKARRSTEIVRLHQEAEVVRHGRGVVAQFLGRKRRVVGAVYSHRAQERVLRVGGQPLARQQRLRIRAAVDDSLPAWEGPRGGPEAQLARQSRRGGREILAHLCCFDPCAPVRLAPPLVGDRAEQIELWVGKMRPTHGGELTRRRLRRESSGASPSLRSIPQCARYLP